MIHISPMIPSDLDQVLEIDPSFLKSELGQQAATLLVARSNPPSPPLSKGGEAPKGQGGFIIGYIDFWKVLDEIHLINIAVHPDYRRRGIATQLFEQIPPRPPLTKGGKGGFKIYLEVRVSNEAAKKFYEKCGFQVIGERKNYYPDGEDAYVLST